MFRATKVRIRVILAISERICVSGGGAPLAGSGHVCAQLGYKEVSKRLSAAEGDLPETKRLINAVKALNGDKVTGLGLGVEACLLVCCRELTSTRIKRSFS